MHGEVSVACFAAIGERIARGSTRTRAGRALDTPPRRESAFVFAASKPFLSSVFQVAQAVCARGDVPSSFCVSAELRQRSQPLRTAGQQCYISSASAQCGITLISPSFPSQLPASRSPHARPPKAQALATQISRLRHRPPSPRDLHCSMSLSFWADACNYAVNRPLQAQLDAAHASCGLTVRRAAVLVCRLLRIA